MCVVNGRVTPQFDNWTSVSVRGSAVVDYFIVPYEQLSLCDEFKVCTAREMVEKYCDVSCITNTRNIIPDHSILLFKSTLNVNKNVVNTDTSLTDYGNNLKKCDARYDVQNIPSEFFNNAENSDRLLQMIENITELRNDQNEINSVYNDVCNLYYDEMKKWLKSKNVNPKSHKRLKKCCKPFWSNRLQELWDSLRKAENIYLSSRGRYRRSNLESFRASQKKFDKEYRKAERKFNFDKQCEIESVCTENPKQFWQHLKSLGPSRNKDIPMEIINQNGDVDKNINNVLDHWKNEYKNLFSFGESSNVDTNSTSDDVTLTGINDIIDFTEVEKVVKKAKNNKAVGFDNLPNEILKNENTITLLTCLFNKIFTLNRIPSVWSTGIIKPVPKSSLTDPRVPLQYRGITLLSTIYKLFSSVLNNRIVHACTTYDLLVDEQNGFRSKRACIDHLFVLNSIIRNRKKRNLSTLTCFIDFEKAFDRIDRNLLFAKLKKLGLNGNMLNCIKAIYSHCKCMVNINGHLTESFDSHFGVRQGDNLSPTLFNLFINDLVTEINNGSRGVACGDTFVHCLLYADDLVVISDDENDLQKMLDILHSWCSRWKMKINADKSKIVHFRGLNQMHTEYVFKLGNEIIECVDKYKYLGVVLHYSLNYEMSSAVLAKSAGRALGSICTKFRKIKGLGFKTFTKMFHAGVTPILDYCSGIWGNGSHTKIDTIQNRALRFFLGVHRFAPNLAVQGDCGWQSSECRRKLEMTRLWNRLVSMDRNRITYKIFEWDHALCCKNWSKEIKTLFELCDLNHAFLMREPVSISHVKNVICEKSNNIWKENVTQVSKLRTYNLYKCNYTTEPYLYKVVNRQHRSILAQFRCGILPLRIETGRFQNISPELRLCVFCNDNVIEDENHFLLHCCKYNEARSAFYEKLHIVNNTERLSDAEKLNLLMSEQYIKQTAEFIWRCFDMRQKTIYH
jgi:hypothetical protein